MLQRQKELIAVCILFLVLTWASVSLRVYARAILLKKWGHDDSAMVITLVLFTITVTVQMLSVVHGIGYHQWELTPEEARTALIYVYVNEIFYVLVGVGLKVSLGIFYLRIAIVRWQTILIKCIIWGSVIFGFACTWLVVFQCVPVSTFWLIYPANDHCIPPRAQNALTFTLNAMNALTDWILGTIPIVMVRNLNLSFQTKCLVVAILGFAAVGSTGTIVRMKYVKNLTNGPEFTYVLVDVAIWSTVEPGIGITAASIATLRPVLQNILWRLGLAPPPSHVTTQPIGSGDGRPSGQYRLNRLRPSHRSEDLEAIQGSTSTTTTITASLSHKIKA